MCSTVSGSVCGLLPMATIFGWVPAPVSGNGARQKEGKAAEDGRALFQQALADKNAGRQMELTCIEFEPNGHWTEQPSPRPRVQKSTPAGLEVGMEVTVRGGMWTGQTATVVEISPQVSSSQIKVRYNGKIWGCPGTYISGEGLTPAADVIAVDPALTLGDLMLRLGRPWNSGGPYGTNVSFYRVSADAQKLPVEDGANRTYLGSYDNHEKWGDKSVAGIFGPGDAVGIQPDRMARGMVD